MEGKIKGYRSLTEQEVNAINTLKKVEERLTETLDAAEVEFDANKRYLALARTHLETGFMFAVKAIDKPT